MLDFLHFTKTYRGASEPAVKDLNISVQPGDIYGFIGHNGAGKTTAIRCAVGVLDFDGGDVLINGVSVKEHPVECKKNLAYIPDNPDIYEHLTGAQYIDFISDMYSVSTADKAARLEKYASAFEMTGVLSDLVGSYSHGMKQKICLIAALMHAPKLLVLDEPFVGLDPKASHTLKIYMKELCEQGSAIFFSTHVLEVAEKLCNRIAIIKHGSLVASGETDAVRGTSTLEDVFLELTE